MPTFDIYLDSGVCVEAANEEEALKKARLELAERARFDSTACFIIERLEDDEEVLDA